MPFRIPIALALAAGLCALPAAVHAQNEQAPAEARVLADGYARLAKGDAAGAAVVAWQELGRSPNSAAALALAVEAEVARGGAAGGLTAYERWLGSRRLDSAYVLRRVARAILLEAAHGRQPEGPARLAALAALAADGDAEAAAALEEAARARRFGETRALAALGNERAVNMLIAQLGSMPGSKAPIIEALGESGSRLAVPPLKALLTDANDLNRAAAADALGRLGATDATQALRALLKDPMFTVRLKAAGALFRLGDSSGLGLLSELSSSEHAGVRVAAARELASQPDGAWQALVRSLAGQDDPTVRLEAARLIAPYDRPLADSLLSALMREDNIGIREAAASIFVEQVAADFAALRGLLHHGDLATRVKAAGRILELTR